MVKRIAIAEPAGRNTELTVVGETVTEIKILNSDDGTTAGRIGLYYPVTTPGVKRLKDSQRTLEKLIHNNDTADTELLPSAVTPTAITTTGESRSQSVASNNTVAVSVSAATTPMTCPKAIASVLWNEANYCCVESKASIGTKKRSNYISWDDYFMAVATLSAKRSKDPYHPTGACIVDPSNRIIGIGYNGFPAGCSDDVLPWDKGTVAQVLIPSVPSTVTTTPVVLVTPPWLHTQTPYMVHAEVNAILNKCSHDCNGARIYVQHFPCNECAKVIIQSRIAEVVFVHDETTVTTKCNSPTNDDNAENDNTDMFRASRILLSMAGVRMRQYHPKCQRLELNFYDALDVNEGIGARQRDKFATAFIFNDNDQYRNTCNAKSETLVERNYDHKQLLWKEAQYNALLHRTSSKRTDYLSWDDYFMSMAFLTAQRSKDPNTQVGACIVDTNQRIVGLGYNGFPSGCSDDYLPWSRGETATTTTPELHKKYMYVCHAEVNAILNKGSADVRGGTLYVALFPCNECSKVIIQAGIREVVYMSDRYHNTDSCKASRILLQMAGIRLRNYIPSVASISIDMNDDGRVA